MLWRGAELGRGPNLTLTLALTLTLTLALALALALAMHRASEDFLPLAGERCGRRLVRVRG